MTASKTGQKTRVNLTVQENVKEKVQSRLENSSLTMSELAEEAFRDFLRAEGDWNPDAVYDKVEEYQCSDCGGIFTGAVLEKTGGECPGCGKNISGENP